MFDRLPFTFPFNLTGLAGAYADPVDGALLVCEADDPAQMESQTSGGDEGLPVRSNARARCHLTSLRQVTKPCDRSGPVAFAAARTTTGRPMLGA